MSRDLSTTSPAIPSAPFHPRLASSGLSFEPSTFDFQPPALLALPFSSSTFNRFLFNVPFPKFFPCHTSENSPVSPGIATDPKTPFSKSCICHTSETPRGRFSTFQPSAFQHSNDSAIYPLSFQILPHSIALFCAHEKLNSFLFKRFRTLRPKPPGWGGVTNFNRRSRPEPLGDLVGTVNLLCPVLPSITGHRSRPTIPRPVVSCG